MGQFLRRIYYLLTSRRRARELAEEMEFHREMSASHGGRSFGDPLRLREESRDAWGWTWIERTLQDIRYALRAMRRAPGFTLAAIVMLAVGIGVNVAAFGFFNLVTFKPLPVKNPESLVRFHRAAPGEFSTDLPYPAMAFYREHSRTLSAVLALDFGALMPEDSDKPAKAFFVTNNFLSELGARAAAGRLLPAEEPRAEDAPVAVLGYDYWQTRYGGDSSIIGQTIRLNGKPVTVIGATSREFSGLSFSPPDIWIPIAHQPYFVAGSTLLTNLSANEDGVDVGGRMRPGVSKQAVAEEMKALTAELRKSHPDHFWKDERLMVEPGGYAQNAGGRSRGNAPSPTMQQKMAPLLALVGTLTLLILAVTCGNIGSLLLARGVARQREISIRTAIGAGRGRLIRQLLTESLVLAAVGAGAAIVLGQAVLKQLFVWTRGPVWLDLSPDWRVIAFTVGMAALAALIFGLTPAVQLVRSSQRASFARLFLIGTQVAASCVLLIVAALLLRAIDRATFMSPGFEYKRVIAVEPRLGFHGFKPEEARGYLDRLNDRLRGVPGVEAVSLAVTPPLGNRSTTLGGEKNGKQFPIYMNFVDPEYFETMRIEVLRGRAVRAGETNAIVVSASLARNMWPGEEPVGQKFSIDDKKFDVAGVVADARANALADADAVELYRVVQENDLPGVAVLIRVAGPAEEFARQVAEAARTTDTRVVPSIETLSSAFARKIDGTGRSAAALGVLAGVALALACLGIVGVVALAVSQREKEIGIRMAIGATPAHVLGVVARQFWKPIVIGLIIGAGGASALTQLLRRELYGVSPLDPLAYAAAMGLLALTALAAVLLPARRALRVDPMRALRCE